MATDTKVATPGMDVIAWLAGGQRGISANTIITNVCGVDAMGRSRQSHPHDPDDLTRCVRLLERCPSVAAEFGRMRDVNPVWAGLVDAWDELVAMLDAEIPSWRAGMWGSAPKTYARMKQIVAAGGGHW